LGLGGGGDPAQIKVEQGGAPSAPAIQEACQHRNDMLCPTFRKSMQAHRRILLR